MESIPTLIERYGRTQRLVGDYRACLIRSDLGTDMHKDCRIALDRVMAKLARVENTLEDLGLLNTDDRHTTREMAKKGSI
jgi:hypothetical protein